MRGVLLGSLGVRRAWPRRPARLRRSPPRLRRPDRAALVYRALSRQVSDPARVSGVPRSIATVATSVPPPASCAPAAFTPGVAVATGSSWIIADFIVVRVYG